LCDNDTGSRDDNIALQTELAKVGWLPGKQAGRYEKVAS
jgi:hypothetical protein